MFRVPTIQGVIDRRMLVNFRVDPDVAARLLPPPFRPKLVAGHAMAGIRLIRLKHIRPASDSNPLGSFATFTGAPWWPGKRLDDLPEKFGRRDENATRYWSLWVDRASGKLYAEYGNW